MFPKILSWNIRGMNDDRKRYRLKRWISRWNPNVICLQETKLSCSSGSHFRDISNFSNIDFRQIHSNGASGGIVVIWNTCFFSLVQEFSGDFCIGVLLEDVSNGMTWGVSCVYGPNDRSNRSIFFEELKLCLSSFINVPLCFIGDFNSVRNDFEFRGNSRSAVDFAPINDFILENQLLDLPLIGASFTWSNLREQPSLSRIDRALVNASFESSFPECRLVALNRVCSDHRAIILNCNSLPTIKRPWRFESMWILHDDFLPFISGWWSECHIRVDSLGSLAKKLKLLKDHLKRWNKDIFGRVESQISEIAAQISSLDVKEEEGSFSENDRINRCNLKCKLDSILRKEEVMWRQKSGIRWLKNGDKNTSFFHRCANARRRQNWVERIKISGQIFSGHVDISKAVADHFCGLYNDNFCESCPLPTNLHLSEIDCHTSADLTRPFMEEEVFNIIRISEGDKSPGPDGFNMSFLKRCWGIIKQDVMAALLDFQSSCLIPIAVNSSFICLIPKKNTIGDIRDLRPISLVGIIYKLLSKCLMSRFRMVLKEVISPCQAAFLEGRQITEASLIANELLDSRRAAGKSGIVLKLDLEKAFDSVNWNSILFMLDRFGFSALWVKWIHACISSVHFSVLVNGEPSGFFRIKKGLRQGDSLSPYLFLCAMEILSNMMSTANSLGLFRGFYMNDANECGEICHLLYADDTLLFCDAEESQVRNLLAVLLCFQSVTGLRINFLKSRIFSIGHVPDLLHFAAIFGCEVGNFPTIYLGLPLGGNPSSLSLWNPVIAQVNNRLDSWKVKHLSFGGRLVMVKHVLESLPIYYMSLFKAPCSVINQIEKKMRTFLWCGNSEKRHFHAVHWNLVKADLNNGGLGITDLRCMNLALLSKWFWRYAVSPNGWWRRLLDIKNGSTSSSWRLILNSGFGRWSIWKKIIHMDSIFWKFAIVNPGGGYDTSFWTDYWVRAENEGNLKILFPRVFAAASFKDASVSDCFCIDDGQWNIDLQISLRGGAYTELLKLNDLLHSIPTTFLGDGPAYLSWPASKSSKFTVHSMFSLLSTDRFSGLSFFPRSVVWKRGIPSKICSFIWMCFAGKIATMDSLKNKGWCIANRCSMCCKDEESMSHLFLHCEFSLRIWQHFLLTLNCVTALSSDVKVFISAWPSLTFEHPKLAQNLLHALFWNVWLERNLRIFQDKSTPITGIISKIALSISRWAAAEGKVSEADCRLWLANTLPVQPRDVH
ncbi:LINE-1 retrotransposable element ORF2 protein [Linum grandiflorum]